MRRRIGQTQERRRIWWRPSKCRSFMWLCLYSHGPRKKIKRTHKYDFYFEFHSFQGTQWWPPGTPWTRRAPRRCHWQSRRASNIEINMYLPTYPSLEIVLWHLWQIVMQHLNAAITRSNMWFFSFGLWEIQGCNLCSVGEPLPILN